MHTSGNCFKVRLVLCLQGREFEYIPMVADKVSGKSEMKTPAFLVKNPAGEIPVLETDDGTLVAQSNAILFHLAQGTDLWPSDPLAQTRVLEWMFWEQYNHEPNVAVYRSWSVYGIMDRQTAEARAAKEAGSRAAIQRLEDALTGRDWLVGGSLTIADIGLFAYSHLIEDIGFALSDYPAMSAWIARIKALPGYRELFSWRD